MSLRKAKKQVQASEEELNRLRELNLKKDQLIMQGMSAEHAKRMIEAEKSVYAIKSTDKAKAGDAVSDNFKRISDLDPSQGIVIRNPKTDRNELILGRDNNLLNLDGSMHPATVRYLKHRS
jgi:hypothetical protein